LQAKDRINRKRDPSTSSGCQFGVWPEDRDTHVADSGY
jgi:hypothetical protein